MGRADPMTDREYQHQYYLKHRRVCPACGKPMGKAGRQCVHCQSGPRHPYWRGGRSSNCGYVWIYVTEHPGANNRGYVPEHRLVMERAVGRLLRPEEVVHHINEDRADNREENLMLFPNQGRHRAFHAAMVAHG
jgi:hypothetical protein